MGGEIILLRVNVKLVWPSHNGLGMGNLPPPPFISLPVLF